jgi:hypothetical protein
MDIELPPVRGRSLVLAAIERLNALRVAVVGDEEGRVKRWVDRHMRERIRALCEQEPCALLLHPARSDVHLNAELRKQLAW